jgi:hypothetical protein
LLKPKERAGAKTISLPTTCAGQPVQEAWVDVIVEGLDGERTAYTYGFAN